MYERYNHTPDRLRLFNPLSQHLEVFVPYAPTVTMYVCGITPYDTTHLGHVFTYAATDILIRYLEFLGYRICYVQNLTDIDDPILREAQETGENWRELGIRWAIHFIEDMQTLNILPPDQYPRATGVIEQIIQTVQKLLEAGVAYVAGGSVYFYIDSWPDYGKLSRLTREEMLSIANERGNNPDDPHKRHPLDFVLWKAQQSGEPAWESPWGWGRPGWHIECSTIASHFLGETIDIHGGGSDLVFPHHESEIAQSECATGQQPFVRYWFHTAMVCHAGEKMSKSVGNLIMVRDLLETCSPDGLRLYLGSHHYRHSWEHNLAELERAEQVARTLCSAVMRSGGTRDELDPAPYWQAFTDAMDNDLDTPSAVQVLEGCAREIEQEAQAAKDVERAQYALREMSRILGLRLDDKEDEERVIKGWSKHVRDLLVA